MWNLTIKWLFSNKKVNNYKVIKQINSLSCYRCWLPLPPLALAVCLLHSPSRNSSSGRHLCLSRGSEFNRHLPPSPRAFVLTALHSSRHTTLWLRWAPSVVLFSDRCLCRSLLSLPPNRNLIVISRSLSRQTVAS